jgi:methionyl-tRNA synthetase
MAGNDVLMVSGTDEHGTAIQVKADGEGADGAQTADKYHRSSSRTCRAWACPTTCTPAPPRSTTRSVVQELFRSLYDNGYVVAQRQMGAISPVDRPDAGRPLHRGHLPDLRLRRAPAATSATTAATSSTRST